MVRPEHCLLITCQKDPPDRSQPRNPSRSRGTWLRTCFVMSNTCSAVVAEVSAEIRAGCVGRSRLGIRDILNGPCSEYGAGAAIAPESSGGTFGFERDGVAWGEGEERKGVEAVISQNTSLNSHLQYCAEILAGGFFHSRYTAHGRESHAPALASCTDLGRVKCTECGYSYSYSCYLLSLAGGVQSLPPTPRPPYLALCHPPSVPVPSLFPTDSLLVPKEIIEKILSTKNQNRRCSDCGTANTTSWRRCRDTNQLLCSACSIHHKLNSRRRLVCRLQNGRPRLCIPVHLPRTGILFASVEGKTSGRCALCLAASQTAHKDPEPPSSTLLSVLCGGTKSPPPRLDSQCVSFWDRRIVAR